jgi:hypothetical protein
MAKKTKETIQETTQWLAAFHRKLDPGIRQIYYIPDDRVIRMVEVTESVPYTGQVVPFGFKPLGRIDYPSIFVLLHPREWSQIRRGKLKLPWKEKPVPLRETMGRTRGKA